MTTDFFTCLAKFRHGQGHGNRHGHGHGFKRGHGHGRDYIHGHGRVEDISLQLWSLQVIYSKPMSVFGAVVRIYWSQQGWGLEFPWLYGDRPPQSPVQGLACFMAVELPRHRTVSKATSDVEHPAQTEVPGFDLWLIGGSSIIVKFTDHDLILFHTGNVISTNY